MSKPWPCLSRLSDSRTGARISAATPTGTLTKKIHSHERKSTRTAAEENAGSRADAADRAPGAQCDVALTPLGEHRDEDR